jgi:hypothetical protein
MPDDPLPEPDLGDLASPGTAPDAPAVDDVVDPDATAETGEIPEPKPDRVTWIGYVIPISIVLIASLGIFVGYRAERHAGSAAESDQGAISASLNEQRLYSDAVLQAEGAQSNYAQWVALEQVARAEPSNLWCVHGPTTTESVAFVPIIVSCELALTIGSNDLPGYGQRQGFNVSQYAGDLQAANSFIVNTDTRGELTTAEQERVAERRMLAIGVTLSLALALCTIAQQAYRRQWRARNRSFSLYLAVPGWITAIACIALVATWRA